MTLQKDDLGHHISQQFNQELENLRSHVLQMGGVVSQQIAEPVKDSLIIEAGVPRGPFGGYTEDPHSRYFALTL